MDPQAQNSYSYVNNNPLKYKDYNGEILPLLAAYAVVYAPVWIPAVITATAAVTATIASYNLGQAIKNTAKGDYKAADKNLNTVEGSLAVAGTVASGGLAADAAINSYVKTTAQKNNWGKPETLQDHTERHGPDFGTKSINKYSQKAQEFRTSIGNSGVESVTTRSGVTKIYDIPNNIYGSYNRNGSTKTFMKPDPSYHGLPTNYDYWRSVKSRR